MDGRTEENKEKGRMEGKTVECVAKTGEVWKWKKEGRSRRWKKGRSGEREGWR